MQISNMNISPNAPETNMSNFFNMIRSKCKTNNNNFIYPHHFLNSFHNIFFTFFANQTQYNSFTTMLIKNNYINKFTKSFPLTYFIQQVELVNEQLLFGDNDGDDYIVRSELSYDVHANMFWFAKYLHAEVKLPLFYIYEQYQSLKNENRLFVDMIKLCIVKDWCNVVDAVVEGRDKEHNMRRDYIEFIGRKNEIKEMVDNIAEDVKKKEIQLMYNECKYKKIEQYVNCVVGVVRKVIVKLMQHQNKVSGGDVYTDNNVDMNGHSLFSK